MNSKKIRRLVLTALFAALTCTATALLHIPSPAGGYFNLGDTVILLGAFLLGPVCGAIAGGIGAALADILLSFVLYAPATLLIKFLTALTAACILRAMRKRRMLGAVIGAAAGELVMVLGYFLYEWVLYGFAGSAESMLTVNLPQAAVGAAAAVIVFFILDRAHISDQFHGGASSHDR